MERPRKCGAARYISLRSSADPKRKKKNTDIFMRYFAEMQDLIADTWNIKPETVWEFGQVANFREMHHIFWMQAKRDKSKEWMKTQLLRHARRNPKRGLGVAQRMEGTRDSNCGTELTNSNAGKTIPSAPNMQKWGRN
jgi:hypothetical protein